MPFTPAPRSVIWRCRQLPESDSSSSALDQPRNACLPVDSSSCQAWLGTLTDVYFMASYQAYCRDESLVDPWGDGYDEYHFCDPYGPGQPYESFPDDLIPLAETLREFNDHPDAWQHTIKCADFTSRHERDQHMKDEAWYGDGLSEGTANILTAGKLMAVGFPFMYRLEHITVNMPVSCKQTELEQLMTRLEHQVLPEKVTSVYVGDAWNSDNWLDIVQLFGSQLLDFSILTYVDDDSDNVAAALSYIPRLRRLQTYCRLDNQLLEALQTLPDIQDVTTGRLDLSGDCSAPQDIRSASTAIPSLTTRYRPHHCRTTPAFPSGVFKSVTMSCNCFGYDHDINNLQTVLPSGKVRFRAVRDVFVCEAAVTSTTVHMLMHALDPESEGSELGLYLTEPLDQEPCLFYKVLLNTPQSITTLHLSHFFQGIDVADLTSIPCEHGSS